MKNQFLSPGGPYYAKSPGANGRQPTVAEHCAQVSALAKKFGQEINCADAAGLAGILHDFGKYGWRFQDVLNGLCQHIDHASGGATMLLRICVHVKNVGRYIPVIEAIYGHHDGLVEWPLLEQRLRENIQNSNPIDNDAGKRSSLAGTKEFRAAFDSFHRDHPDWTLPSLPDPNLSEMPIVERMLYTRMLFSCLVDADYSVSASDEHPDYLTRSEAEFDPQAVLQSLNDYRASLCAHSDADPALNRMRNEVFRACGEVGASAQGLFTLTAPTGTGKTLALLHFALRCCIGTGKKRIIIVLPYLSITQQNAAIYRQIYPQLLEDHSQSRLSDEMRDFASRWSAPLIVTTSVRFFESLFSDRPTDCRKLHHIANSVIIFDEAQSLPANLTSATLQSVQALCSRYHTTMLFSTATQPDYDAIPDLSWRPREILSDPAELYNALRRTNTNWAIADGTRTSLMQIAEEMAEKNSVCAIVNLRRHARKLYGKLCTLVPEDEVFYLTTDLCPADRKAIIERITQRLDAHLPCRVVATQCIEAGVDFDFDVVYRALAPLDAIIQAAGRCNRNGRLPAGGEVVVFIPDEPGRLYPSNWYEQGAQKTQALLHRYPIDIHNPAHIRAYYQLLLQDARDKPALREALEYGSYAQTAHAYRLIENEGMRILVPSAAEPELYCRLRTQALSDGMTPALMKAAASISVSCFADRDSRLDSYLEPIPCARRNKRTDSKPSGFYLLRPQHEALYTEKTGLQFPDSEHCAEFEIL